MKKATQKAKTPKQGGKGKSKQPKPEAETQEAPPAEVQAEETKPQKATAKKPKESSAKLSCLDAAAQVLKDKGEPMRAKEMKIPPRSRRTPWPPAPPGLAQRDEQGVELYYNFALAPWCHLTTDLQIVEPSTRAFKTTVLAGARLKIDF